MSADARRFLFFAALTGALAVMLGAFWHALALGLVGLLAIHLRDSGALRVAGWLMLLGIVVFSGSLYAMALSGVRALGMVTPLGGLAFIAGWVALAIAVRR